MKVGGRQIDGFLRAPPAGLRAALFYGPDAGKTREYAGRLAQRLCGSGEDPFNTVEIGPQRLKEDPSAIADEAAALSLLGGRRLVRVPQATDALVPRIADALDGAGEALIVIEGTNALTGRSKLVKLLEGAADGAAIACYPDEARDLPGFVQGELERLGVRADGEAVEMICARLGPDRGLNRQEMEKLALGAEDDGRIAPETVALLLGDSAETDLEALSFAVLEGRLDRVLKGYRRLTGENVAPVRILNAVARHVDRMHRAASLMAGGAGAKDALGQVGFRAMLWKLEPSLTAQLRRWPLGKLAWAAERLLSADGSCRSTGAPAVVLAEAALFDLARAARAPR